MMKMAMSSGAQPNFSRLTTAQRVWRSGVCKGTSAASTRCCIRRPEGPAEVNLRKDLRMSIRLTSGRSVTIHGKGMAGQALLGVLTDE